MKKTRYRKVDIRMWSDTKFQQLSHLPPSGQSAWIYLLLSPNTTAIPGLFKAGRKGMAEDLGWTLNAFDKAFTEVITKGMAEIDWEHRVVWIPNAIHYNKPESPNVVTGWGKAWPEIPECDLKTKAYGQLKGFVEGLSEPFREAFREAFRKGNAQPLVNQEQEQEQEQEQDKKRGPNGPTKKSVLAERPDLVSEQVWKDFLIQRKEKKAPVTATALKGIASEADKAGVTLEDALTICCQSGWQGFRADWWKRATTKHGSGAVDGAEDLLGDSP